MNESHDQIENLFSVLEKPHGFFGKVTLKAKLAALDSIARGDNRSYIAKLFGYLFSSEKQISEKTAETIHSILQFNRKNDSKWWECLARDVRYVSVKPSDVRLLLEYRNEIAVDLLGITSLNHSGYIREESIKYLRDFDFPGVIPLLLLRLSDWVPEVRNAAKQAFLSKLAKFPFQELLEYYEIIDWLERVQRVNLLIVRQSIFECLVEKKNREPLLRIIGKFPTKKRLFCWKALRMVFESDPKLVDLAMTDSDPEIRSWVVSVLKVDQYLKQRLITLIQDKSIRVRNAAVKLLALHYDPSFESLLLPIVYDEAQRLREIARDVLSKHGEFSFSEMYQSELLNSLDRPKPGVLAGFIETGGPDIEEDLLGFVGHSNAKIRCLALNGVAKIQGQKIELLAIDALKDPSTKVKGAASSILGSSGFYFDRNAVYSLLKSAETDGTGDFATQKVALKLLAGIGGADSAIYLIKVTEENENLKGLAIEKLGRWLGKYETRPYFNDISKTIDKVRSVLQKYCKNRG